MPPGVRGIKLSFVQQTYKLTVGARIVPAVRERASEVVRLIFVHIQKCLPLQGSGGGCESRDVQVKVPSRKDFQPSAEWEGSLQDSRKRLASRWRCGVSQQLLHGSTCFKYYLCVYVVAICWKLRFWPLKRPPQADDEAHAEACFYQRGRDPSSRIGGNRPAGCASSAPA